MSNQTIVIVEDDLVLAEVVSLYLQKEGYSVLVFNNAEDAWLHIQHQFPGLLLLDVTLPGETGFQLAEKFRKVCKEGIVIFLTGNTTIEEKLTGFRLGGDDYITKPFIPEELIARVKAQFRRKQEKEMEKQELQIGDLCLNFLAKTVHKKEQELELFVKEKKLLFFLAENYGRIFSSEELFAALWNWDSEAELKTVAVHISNIRKKIEDDPKQPKFLHTVRGFGYKLYYNSTSPFIRK